MNVYSKEAVKRIIIDSLKGVDTPEDGYTRLAEDMIRVYWRYRRAKYHLRKALSILDGNEIPHKMWSDDGIST